MLGGSDGATTTGPQVLVQVVASLLEMRSSTSRLAMYLRRRSAGVPSYLLRGPERSSLTNATNASVALGIASPLTNGRAASELEHDDGLLPPKSVGWVAECPTYCPERMASLPNWSLVTARARLPPADTVVDDSAAAGLQVEHQIGIWCSGVSELVLLGQRRGQRSALSTCGYLNDWLPELRWLSRTTPGSDRPILRIWRLAFESLAARKASGQRPGSMASIAPDYSCSTSTAKVRASKWRPESAAPLQNRTPSASSHSC